MDQAHATFKDDDDKIFNVLNSFIGPTLQIRDLNIFKKAMASVTRGEVNRFYQNMDAIQEMGYTFPVLDETEIRVVLTGLRWVNSICNNCENTNGSCKAIKGLTSLGLCKGCYLVQYCSSKCQDEDHTHQLLCGKPDSLAYETGPQRQVLGRMNVKTGQVESI